MRNLYKLIGIIALAAVIGFMMISCGDNGNGNGDGNGDETPTPQTVTYISSDSEGNLYTLEITENVQRSARYSAKTGDSFKFTVELFNNGNYSVALSVEGIIESSESSGTEIEINITVNGSPLNITINGTDMTVIEGTIILDNEEEITITEPLTPVVDKRALEAAINSANTAKQGVVVSVDGSEVLTTIYWVSESRMDTFTTAIATAQAVYDNEQATQSMVDTQKITLETATTVFNGQKQLGTKVEQQETEYDIYVAGSYFNGTVSLPCYWKNGVRVDLTLPAGEIRGSAEKIIVDGNDIHVLGSVDNDERVLGCYWKNGTITVVDGRAGDIAVINGDVYIVGDYDDMPAYWKNGERFILTIGNNQYADIHYGRAQYIAISNNIVHIMGSWGAYYTSTGNFETTNCYWINGSRSDLNINEGFQNLGISGFALSGNDIYLSGSYNFENSNSVACYWKNGVRTNLPSGFSVAETQDIFINNGDVYIVGNVGEYQNRKAYYWKNSQSYALSGGDINKESFAYAITVIGDDVFIAGSIDNFFNFDGENFTSGSTACYWKNGELVILSENASASGIFVVER